MMLPRRGWLQRLRHGRGFGVHSPWAYRFIREVLRERLPYYAYPEVDSLAKGWPGGREHARMLMRIAAFMQPCVAAVGDAALSAAAGRIVTLGCAAAQVQAEITAGADFIVLLPGAAFDADAVLTAAAAEGTVVIPDRRPAELKAVLERLRTELPTGHTFVNGSGAAIYAGNEAPAQTFQVRF